MKTFLFCLTAFLSSLQAGLCYLWTSKDGKTIEQFRNMLDFAYGDVPLWTTIAFSFGVGWYGVAFLWIALAGSTFHRRVPDKVINSIVTLSVFVLLGMFYAMYPIHFMLTHSMNI
ncbi:hypothetical protein [Reinekea blandensis]|nr:hypothetical protein [Reinekea blandensis]